MGLWSSIKKVGKGIARVGGAVAGGLVGGPGGAAAGWSAVSGLTHGGGGENKGNYFTALARKGVAAALEKLDKENPIAGAWTRVEIARGAGADAKTIAELEQNARNVQTGKPEPAKPAGITTGANLNIALAVLAGAAIIMIARGGK